MPLSTLMFLYRCSANGAAAGADWGGVLGVCARAPAIAAAIESVATRELAKILFAACGIEKHPTEIWRQECTRGTEENILRDQPRAIIGGDGCRLRLSSSDENVGPGMRRHRAQCKAPCP